MLLAVALAAVSGAHVAARAQDAEPAVVWDAPCGEPAAFVAGVEELGGSFDGFEVEVGVGETEAGAFHGQLSIRRGGEELAVRELDDPLCTDVVDALVIAAALALRSLPPPAVTAETFTAETATAETATAETATAETATAETATAETADPMVAEPPAPAPPTESPDPDTSLRFALGASLRGGLGPTPGPALVPGVTLALQLERLFAGLSFAYWPDAGATLEGSTRGVSLWALSASVEAGYRIGDALSVVPCVVLEPSVTFARGVGVERPRAEASFVLDAGFALWLALDLGDRVRLFARGDLLFGAVRPAYGIEGELVFAGPVLRGTGGVGVLALF